MKLRSFKKTKCHFEKIKNEPNNHSKSLNLEIAFSCLKWYWSFIDDLLLFFKIIFILKYIKIIFFIFKKLFLISAHQNDLKIPKKILIWIKEKNFKNLKFFKNTFKTQK